MPGLDGAGFLWYCSWLLAVRLASLTYLVLVVWWNTRVPALTFDERRAWNLKGELYLHVLKIGPKSVLHFLVLGMLVKVPSIASCGGATLATE